MLIQRSGARTLQYTLVLSHGARNTWLQTDACYLQMSILAASPSRPKWPLSGLGFSQWNTILYSDVFLSLLLPCFGSTSGIHIPRGGGGREWEFLVGGAGALEAECGSARVVGMLDRPRVAWFAMGKFIFAEWSGQRSSTWGSATACKHWCENEIDCPSNLDRQFDISVTVVEISLI